MKARLFIGNGPEVEDGLNRLFKDIEKTECPEINTIKYAMTDNVISALVIFEEPLDWEENDD